MGGQPSISKEIASPDEFYKTAALLGTRTPVFPRAIPFIAVAVLWIAAYLFIRARQQGHLKRELEEFDEIAMRNR